MLFVVEIKTKIKINNQTDVKPWISFTLLSFRSVV